AARRGRSLDLLPRDRLPRRSVSARRGQGSAADAEADASPRAARPGRRNDRDRGAPGTLARDGTKSRPGGPAGGSGVLPRRGNREGAPVRAPTPDAARARPLDEDGVLDRERRTGSSPPLG